MAEVGSRLIFEDERVKVWEFTLAPGETIETHRHERDYFFYPIEGGTLEVTRESGVVQATLEPGKIYYRAKGDSHAARNIGPERYHEILVELKDAAG